MNLRASKNEMVQLSDICAVTCNYARPNNARDCVRRLKDLGLKEIIVWNNGQKPIPEATRNINLPYNIGSIGRYYAGMLTDKPYILIVDDDHLLTEAGLTALRKWKKRYPVVVQLGCVINPPYNNYFNRTSYLSRKIKKPHKVDMVLPFGGMLLKAELYRKIPHHWAWGSQKVIRPGFMTTDLPVSCAICDITGKHPVVVPAEKNGIEMLVDEAPHKALAKQKGLRREKTKMLRWLIAHGWKMIKSQKRKH